MIRKRAEERAKQSELQSYESEPSYEIEPKPYNNYNNKPSSVNSSQRESKEKKPTQINNYAQKRSSQQYEPTEEQLQNAFVNPNYNKKTPSSYERAQNNAAKTPVQA